MKPVDTRAIPTTAPDAVLFRSPQIDDGVRLWEIARDSKVLDLNSSYAYLLWCRDFSATSIVAEVDGRVVGFVSGYTRPSAQETLFVWQVAVDEDQRGKAIAARMLSDLMDRTAPLGVTHLETTISPDNEASIALFTALARRREVPIARQTLFSPNDFPDGHEAEDLYTIGA
ncbi:MULTISPECIES: diaminobutyrate acetyltransferase [Rhodococcus]|uniref:diaminobutyrate acetyltransferase n=1 Tax=Rhodococcus TaxID=1827 RepID=UPI001C213AFB|nr:MULTISPECIES: diaminobutyrate acetyltransferase [Rhodococcus]MCX6472049.1 diaminobutyrate acetyltransferase [Rhodococcus sp. (in: high G+C Gram-positive bacteria)]QXC41027.1 diaminobutyrate acetyltransferase [Rhodococcus qingshengii]